jgi:hypothetical protein
MATLFVASTLAVLGVVALPRVLDMLGWKRQS